MTGKAMSRKERIEAFRATKKPGIYTKRSELISNFNPFGFDKLILAVAAPTQVSVLQLTVQAMPTSLVLLIHLSLRVKGGRMSSLRSSAPQEISALTLPSSAVPLMTRGWVSQSIALEVLT